MSHSRPTGADGCDTDREIFRGECAGPKAACAVPRKILSPGGYQGEGISDARLRAEMGSPWSVPGGTLTKQPDHWSGCRA